MAEHEYGDEPSELSELLLRCAEASEVRARPGWAGRAPWRLEAAEVAAELHGTSSERNSPRGRRARRLRGNAPQR